MMKTQEEIQARVDELLRREKKWGLSPSERFELDALDWVLGE